MTEKAYNEYVQKCKKSGTPPSKREDLEKDPFDDQSHHEFEPIHIRKPRDFTGRVKTITQQLEELPDGKKFLITKEQLLELDMMIRNDKK